jgi:hypothetical protein
MNLKELCEIAETELMVGRTVSKGFYVDLYYTEIMEDGILTSAVGFGRTEKSAMNDLARNLRGQRIRCCDKQFQVPKTLVA